MDAFFKVFRWVMVTFILFVMFPVTAYLIYKEGLGQQRGCVIDRTGEVITETTNHRHQDFFDSRGNRVIMGENETYRCGAWRNGRP